MALLVCVDDIILASNNGHDVPTLKAFLDHTFKLNYFGSLKYFWVLKLLENLLVFQFVNKNVL